MVTEKERAALKWVPENKKDRISNVDLFTLCTNWLRKYNVSFSLLERDYLDYMLCASREEPLINYDDKAYVSAKIIKGGSEGVYVDWDWISGNGQSVHIGTFKTLYDNMRAFETMGRIAGMLKYVSELFWSLNYDAIRIEETKTEPEGGNES